MALKSDAQTAAHLKGALLAQEAVSLALVSKGLQPLGVLVVSLLPAAKVFQDNSPCLAKGKENTG